MDRMTRVDKHLSHCEKVELARRLVARDGCWPRERASGQKGGHAEEEQAWWYGRSVCVRACRVTCLFIEESLAQGSVWAHRRDHRGRGRGRGRVGHCVRGRRIESKSESESEMTLDKLSVGRDRTARRRAGAILAREMESVCGRPDVSRRWLVVSSIRTDCLSRTVPAPGTEVPSCQVLQVCGSAFLASADALYLHNLWHMYKINLFYALPPATSIGKVPYSILRFHVKIIISLSLSLSLSFVNLLLH